MPRLVQIETCFFGIIHCIKQLNKVFLEDFIDLLFNYERSLNEMDFIELNRPV